MVECNPSLAKADTVLVPQITKEVQIDTLFFIGETDTISFIDTVTRTEVIIMRSHDTLRVNIHTPPDTIYVPLEVPKIVVEPCDDKGSIDWWKIVLVFAGIFLVLYAIRTLTK